MQNRKNQSGFSLLELIISMTIMLVLLSIVSTLVARSMSVRTRETQKADGLVSVQAALNVLSREISNSGFGIYSNSVTKLGSNGIITGDSGANQLHIRSNMLNTGARDNCGTACETDQPGEDITYFLDPTTQSIVRYDPHDTPTTSVVVNRVSNLKFHYFHYDSGTSTVTDSPTPTATTSRVRITVEAVLDPVIGQVNPQSVVFQSQVTLRNASYMLQQY